MSNIEKSIKLKAELDALRPLKKEDEMRIMQKFRLDWNYHSNHLEGNTLTYGETKALILFGITAQGKPLKDHFEITGHDEAIKWVIDIVKQERPLTENFIRELHKLILKEPYEVDAITPDGQPTKKRVNIGEYKTSPNHVKTKTGEIFRFATPEETPALMNDLILWYRNKSDNKEANPILLAAEFHYKFIRIHPFDDGNGRTARILMNFILMQFGYPPVIIKTEDKENYFAALRQADAGQIAPFIEYIAQNLAHSLEIMIKGVKGENIEEPDDIDKEIALLEQRLKSIGPTIEITKTRDSVFSAYSQSISELMKRFLEKAALFEKFYVENSVSAFVNERIESFGKASIIRETSYRVDEYTNNIKVQIEYKGFKQKEIPEFGHISQLIIFFDYTRYRVENTAGISIEKLYGEQLSEAEITQLVNSEIKKHRDLIDAKIEELKKNG
ncbi:MAG: Fic family protein [Bacteroidetes bacterium]|nr:Fic family protein [Bacteroidota bacterium]MCB0850986.1 Fic family protein [Bacteroidota bacterium]